MLRATWLNLLYFNTWSLLLRFPGSFQQQSQHFRSIFSENYFDLQIKNFPAKIEFKNKLKTERQSSLRLH